MTRPILALTTGDPAGVGPEVSLRAAANADVRSQCDLVLIGDRRVIEKAAGLTGFKGRLVPHGENAGADDLAVLDPGALREIPPIGKATADGGYASFVAIETAIEGAKKGTFHGVVTGPINKLSLKLAGINFPGHTEVFGARTNSPAFAMMMYSRPITVGLVTCHQSLASVPSSLTRERIVEVGLLLARSMERIRGQQPRLAVLGLNPHSGESGLFGNEEGDVITPAIEDLKTIGLNVTGPLPPDTAFTSDKLKEYDAFLCMYHDQGLIPFKMIAFDEGVNVTMGLPFPRTSVDHGTAYDIAWKGIARESSMIEAILLATRLVGQ